MNFKSAPYFSVIMANYNHANYIGKAIESVLNQTYANWELIIIDDCSTDNSIVTIKKYLFDKRVRLFNNVKNKGYIYTLKKGIELSEGSIIAIIDSDDSINKYALDKVANTYNSEPGAGLVYTQCYYCDENLQPVHMGFSGKIIKSNLHENKINAMRTFNKDSYFKTSGYDDNCVRAEDIDLNLKLEEITNVFFLNEPLYHYRILKKSQTHGFKNEMINRSSTALAKLNAYKRRLNTDIPNLNKTEIAEVLFLGIFTSLLSGRLKLMLKLKLELWRINPLFLFQAEFYSLIMRKIIKIYKLKLNNPTLRKVDSHLT
jgi:glycosyltransferase involved in cell wall biosynthesis